MREAGGEETKTRRPPEQIKADWHQAADQAQAQGWPPKPANLAGFPLTPYDFAPQAT